MAPIGDLLWLAAIGGLFYYMMRRGGGCCSGHSHDDHHHANLGEHGDNKDHAQQSQQFVDLKTQDSPVEQDPVCGMEINKGDSAPASEHFGRTFHFCSEQCRRLFNINPGKYADSV